MRQMVLKAETTAAAKSLETARNRAIRKKLEADGHRKNQMLQSAHDERMKRKAPTLRQVV
jgi:hypothetical protein